VSLEVTTQSGYITGFQHCWFCFTQRRCYVLHSVRQVGEWGVSPWILGNRSHKWGERCRT